MKKLLFILLIICSKSQAQSPIETYYNYSYFAAAGSDAIQNLYVTGVPLDSGTGKRYPIYIEFKGLGQNGFANWSYNNMMSYGWGREIFVDGLNLQVPAPGGGNTQIIYAGISLRFQNNDQARALPCINFLKAYFANILDTNRVYVGGWSMGGMSITKMMTFDTTDAYLNAFNAAMTLAPAAANNPIRDSAEKFDAWTLRGGRLFTLSGNTDPQPPLFPEEILPYAASSGSQGLRWTTTDGLGFTSSGHCCAAHAYDNATTYPMTGNRNFLQWLALFSRKPFVSVPSPSISVTVSSVNLTSNTTEFTGGFSGWQNNRIWEQISGPNTASITTAASDATTATGLVNGTYVFRRKSVNLNGQQAQQDVTVNVNMSGGTIIIYKPRADIITF